MYRGTERKERFSRQIFVDEGSEPGVGLCMQVGVSRCLPAG